MQSMLLLSSAALMIFSIYIEFLTDYLYVLLAVRTVFKVFHTGNASVSVVGAGDGLIVLFCLFTEVLLYVCFVIEVNLNNRELLQGFHLFGFRMIWLRHYVEGVLLFDILVHVIVSFYDISQYQGWALFVVALGGCRY